MSEEIALARSLRERRVVVGVRYSAGFGGVRVYIHGMNNRADVDTLLDAMKDCV